MKLKIAGLTAVLLSAVAIPMLATAGNAYQSGVSFKTFSDGSGYARGQMSGTRLSSDPKEEIGCKIRTTLSSSGTVTYSGGCFATDTTGAAVLCSTSNLSLMQSMQSITDNAYLYFTWRPDGTCSMIEVDVRSSNIP